MCMPIPGIVAQRASSVFQATRVSPSVMTLRDRIDCWPLACCGSGAVIDADRDGANDSQDADLSRHFVNVVSGG
jgi:hypothetical protein